MTGEERLLRAAQQHGGRALENLFPALINEARLFSAEGEFGDDICIVGFKCRSLMGR